MVARSEARLTEKRGLLEEKVFGLGADLEAWAKDNLPDGKKSINLVTGTVGFRRAPDAVDQTLKPATIINRLRSQGFDHCVKTWPKINGKALATLSDKLVATVMDVTRISDIWEPDTPT